MTLSSLVDCPLFFWFVLVATRWRLVACLSATVTLALHLGERQVDVFVIVLFFAVFGVLTLVALRLRFGFASARLWHSVEFVIAEHIVGFGNGLRILVVSK